MKLDALHEMGHEREEQTMSDEDFAELKSLIKAKMEQLAVLQKQYRSVTGRDYQPFM